MTWQRALASIRHHNGRRRLRRATEQNLLDAVREVIYSNNPSQIAISHPGFSPYQLYGPSYRRSRQNNEFVAGVMAARRSLGDGIAAHIGEWGRRGYYPISYLFPQDHTRDEAVKRWADGIDPNPYAWLSGPHTTPEEIEQSTRRLEQQYTGRDVFIPWHSIPKNAFLPTYHMIEDPSLREDVDAMIDSYQYEPEVLGPLSDMLEENNVPGAEYLRSKLMWIENDKRRRGLITMPNPLQ